MPRIRAHLQSREHQNSLPKQKVARTAGISLVHSVVSHERTRSERLTEVAQLDFIAGVHVECA